MSYYCTCGTRGNGVGRAEGRDFAPFLENSVCECVCVCTRVCLGACVCASLLCVLYTLQDVAWLDTEQIFNAEMPVELTCITLKQLTKGS